jgi:hypothetical protein
MNLYPFYRMKSGALRRYNELFDRMCAALLPALSAHLFARLDDFGFGEGGGRRSGSGGGGSLSGGSGGSGDGGGRLDGFDPNAIDRIEAEQIRRTLHTQLMSWMQTLFAKALPLDAASRVFDNFLLDGPVFLFRVAIALLGLLEPEIIGQPQERCILVLTHRTEAVWSERVTEASLFSRIETTNVPDELHDQLTEVLNDPLFFQKERPMNEIKSASPISRRTPFGSPFRGSPFGSVERSGSPAGLSPASATLTPRSGNGLLGFVGRAFGGGGATTSSSDRRPSAAEVRRMF